MIGKHEPRTNQYLTLIVESGAFSGRYVSKMEGVAGNSYIISAPIRNGIIVPFREKTIVRVEYFMRETLYDFTSEVIGRRTRPTPVLIITRPPKVNKIQRRKYVRIEDSIDVHYRVIGEIDALSAQLQPVNLRSWKTEMIREQGMYAAVTRDISGGGLYLILRDIQYGIMFRDIILMKFIIPGTSKILKAIGKIVRYDGPKEFKLDMKPGSVGLAVEFVVIDETARDIIIQHIFKKQRELIRRMKKYKD